jgi:hypothetical protein
MDADMEGCELNYVIDTFAIEFLGRTILSRQYKIIQHRHKLTL